MWIPYGLKDVVEGVVRCERALPCHSGWRPAALEDFIKKYRRPKYPPAGPHLDRVLAGKGGERPTPLRPRRWWTPWRGLSWIRPPGGISGRRPPGQHRSYIGDGVGQELPDFAIWKDAYVPGDQVASRGRDRWSGPRQRNRVSGPVSPSFPSPPQGRGRWGKGCLSDYLGHQDDPSIGLTRAAILLWLRPHLVFKFAGYQHGPRISI
jgi:hypothetical protein